MIRASIRDHKSGVFVLSVLVLVSLPLSSALSNEWISNLWDQTEQGTSLHTSYIRDGDNRMRSDTLSTSNPRTVDDVVINEMMLLPSGGGPWVELHNTGDEQVSIDNWLISDEVQNIIGTYGKEEYGRSLFYPLADGSCTLPGCPSVEDYTTPVPEYVE